jgi:serine/threonine-protein kinase
MKDPDQRPADARILLEQLRDTESVLDLPATGSTAVQKTQVLPGAPVRNTGPTGPLTSAGSPERRLSEAETQVLGGLHRDTGPGTDLALADPRERAPRRRRWTPLVAILAALALIAGGTGWWFVFGPGSLITIPASIQGKTVEEARTILDDLGLEVAETTGTISSVDIPAGAVADADPAIGTAVERESAVTILVSTGPKMIAIDLERGMPQADAEAIVNASWTMKDTIEQFDAELPAGQLVDALGADGSSLIGVSEYGEQQPITLVISAGPVPPVAGITVDEARAALAAVELTVDDSQSSETYDDSIPIGSVISLAATSGPLHPGDHVGLVTSLGPAPVAVPAIIGMTWTEAKAALQAAGLGYAFARNIDESLAEQFPDDATVTSADPNENVMVHRGDVVTVKLGI